MLRVFIVDDSAFTRKALARVLSAGGEIEVVGVATSGREALDGLAAAKPDVVTLDVQMPGMNGVDTLREIVKRWPKLPVIMISAHTRDGAKTTLDALSLGAVDFIDKNDFRVTDIEQLSKHLLEKLRVWMPEAVVPGVSAHTRRTRAARSQRKPGQWRQAAASYPVSLDWSRYDLCVIAASTGGPPAIETIVAAAAKDLPPIVIVQHMPVGFTKHFAERLAGLSKLSVSEAVSGAKLARGTALIAPAGKHLRITPDLSVALALTPAHVAHIPSADVLMQSAAEATGARTLAVMLTGMGDDGAQGMLAIHKAGGLTLAENEESCVVYGMPRAAHAAGGVTYLLPLDDIAQLFSHSS